MTQEYTPPTFYFKLSFSRVSGTLDASFEEVSGISMEMGTEEVSEGGNNRFKHRVPTSVKFTNLVLKRGLAAKNSEVISWCKSTLEEGLVETIETKNIIVHLLNENGDPLKSWSFMNAWPLQWATSDFNTTNNEILIESLEFSFSYFTLLSNNDNDFNVDLFN